MGEKGAWPTQLRPKTDFKPLYKPHSGAEIGIEVQKSGACTDPKIGFDTDLEEGTTINGRVRFRCAC